MLSPCAWTSKRQTFVHTCALWFHCMNKCETVLYFCVCRNGTVCVCEDLRVYLLRWVDLLLPWSDLLSDTKSGGPLEAMSQHTCWCKRVVFNPTNTLSPAPSPWTSFWYFLTSGLHLQSITEYILSRGGPWCKWHSFSKLSGTSAFPILKGASFGQYLLLLFFCFLFLWLILTSRNAEPVTVYLATNWA